MEKIFAKAEKFYSTLKQYAETRIETMKLKTAEKTSQVMASLLAGIIVSIVFLLFIIFFSIALSIILGGWIGQAWSGFLIVAFLYLLIGMVVWKRKAKLIQLPVMNAIIKLLFKNNNDDSQY